ncbi:MAG: plasmid replication protein, CyRepA1 family [Phototrophicaceae bacterium]
MHTSTQFDVQTLKNINCRTIVRNLLGEPHSSTQRYDRYFSPFRADGRKPSLTVYETGIKDYGGSGQSWDVIGFVMAVLSLDFRAACDYLSGNSSEIMPYSPQKRTFNATPPSADWQSATYKQLNKYEDILWQSPRILQYLNEERGLSNATIRKYRLGYNPNWDEFRADAGLCKVAPGIVIPWIADEILYAVRIRTRTGALAIAAAYDDSYLDNKYMSVTGSRQSAGLFGADGLQVDQPLIITEGEFDAMLATQMTGYHAVTRGSAGDHKNISELWRNQLQAVKTLYGILDTDTAGQQATDALLTQFEHFIPLHLPNGKDITDYLLNHNGTAEAILSSLYDAQQAAHNRRAQLQQNDEIEQKFYPKYHPPQLQATVKIDVPFISDASDKIPETGIVILSSDKGTGKTSYGKQIVKTYRDKYKSVMAITPFRSLTAAAGEQYQIEHYGSLYWSQWLQVSNLAITLKSIGNFGTMGQIPTPQLVVLDEFSKMLEQLHSSIYHRNEASQVYTVLKYIIAHAEQVLIMDADIDTVEIDWLKQIRDDVHVVVNTFDRDAGALTVYETRDTLRDSFINTLNQHERQDRPVVFFSNTASEIQTLDTYLKTKTSHKVLSIHSKNSGNAAQQAFLKHPDEHITKYDAILISPSAMTGIDIQTQVYAKFGHFVYSPKHTPSATGCAQLLERARNADHTHIWIEQANGTAEEDHHVIYEDYRQAAMRSNAFLMGLEVNPRGELDLSGITKEIHILQSQLIARDNSSRNHLYENLLNLLARNYTITATNGTTHVHKEAIKAAAKARKAQWDTLVCTSEPINDEVLDALIASGLVTDRVYAGNERYHIEDFYHQGITPDLYDFDKAGKGRYRITNYTQAILIDTATLAQLDWEESENDTPLTARQFRLMKARTINAFINSVWGNQSEFLNNPVLKMRDIAERTEQFMQSYAEDVRLYFKYRHDHKEDSWSIAKRLLRRFGLTFKEIRSRDEFAPKCYQINPKTFATVQQLAQQHLVGVTKKRNSNNQKARIA